MFIEYDFCLNLTEVMYLFLSFSSLYVTILCVIEDTNNKPPVHVPLPFGFLDYLDR